MNVVGLGPHSHVGAVAVRGLIAAFGLSALTWTAFAGPVLLRQALVEDMAKRIIAHEPFKPAAMSSVMPRVDALGPGIGQRPSLLAAAAVIRLRQLEQGVSDGDQTVIDARSDALWDAMRRALAQAPADPFLWCALYWLENMRAGFSKENLKYLQLSYATGPNEGWVAIRRNRLALAVYSQLDAGLAAAAIDEFKRLVGSRFIAQAADILVGAGWPVRDVLLPPLVEVDLAQRQQFAKAVYRLGYDVAVPGVDPRGQRPWD